LNGDDTRIAQFHSQYRQMPTRNNG